MAVGGHHLANAVLRPIQRGLGGHLSDRGDARRVGLEDLGRRVDELLRTRRVADAPAGHRVRLRECEDADDARVVGREARGTRPRAVEDDLVVALVAEQPQVVALREIHKSLDGCDRIHRPCRVVGAVDQQQLRSRRDEALDRIDVRLEPIRGRARIEDAAGCNPCQHQSRVRPARVGHEHLVAGL